MADTIDHPEDVNVADTEVEVEVGDDKTVDIQTGGVDIDVDRPGPEDE